MKAYRFSRVVGISALVVLLLVLPFWIAVGPVIDRQTGRELLQHWMIGKNTEVWFNRDERYFRPR